MSSAIETHRTFRTSNIAKGLMAVTLCGACSVAFLLPGVIPAFANPHNNSPVEHQRLQGERVILGVVEEVRGEQAKVNTGEGQPRFVPMNIREEKGLPALKEGDRVELTVNDQNLLVDLHLPGETSQHKVVHGALAQPLVTGHDKAVIQTRENTEESYFIRPLARSKVASVPVGAEAIFLIDELNQIVDVTYGSREALNNAQDLEQKKTPLKGNFKKVSGLLKKPLQNGIIAIEQQGQEKEYEVRILIQEKFKNLSPGQSVVLFIDDGNKVTDVSFEKEKS